MCVIGYAPAHAKIDDETLETMFYNNPDGAGIMWKPLGNKPVEIKKGFMTAAALLKAWHEIPVECEKAVHCRIATAGRVSAQCCHPFPVRETTLSMKSRHTNTDMAVMHNGIITLTDPPKGIKSPFSDSMMFAKEVLYPLKHALDNVYIQEMLEDSIDRSRLLIFRQHGETIMLGNWIRDGKCYFSNDSYYYDKWYTYSTPKTVTKPVVALPVKKNEEKSDAKVEQLSKATGMTLQSPYNDDGSVSIDYAEADMLGEYGFDEDGAYGAIQAGQDDDSVLIAQAEEYMQEQERMRREMLEELMEEME